ncbi:ribosomal protein S18 acetylase RimI-like enzyme [Leifsonia sp. EB41]|uniref:GNAT family N-acetyltransferase n=1 Tax=Leifsonia sp. EB41 TaxID=3156260 RepID=UPI003511C6FC
MPEVSRRAVMALRTLVLGVSERGAGDPRTVRLRTVEPVEMAPEPPATPSAVRPGTVTLRPAADADEPFLRRVFRDARRWELPGAEGAVLDPALGPKYRAHSADRRDRYPDAETSVVLEDGEPVGTVTLHHEDGRTHVVELAVLAEHRGHGIASCVLTGLLGTHRRLTVTVWEQNRAAQRLYERHGFAVVAEQFGYLLMATEADR